MVSSSIQNILDSTQFMLDAQAAKRIYYNNQTTRM